MRKPLLIALAAYGTLTLLGLALVLGVCLARGDRGLEFLLPRGAWTYSPLILISAALAWVLAGGALLAAWRRPPSRTGRYFFAGLFFLGFLYLNLLREREHFYDLNDYLVAARAVHEHQPLPPRYLYPPLLAVALAPLTPLGEPVFTALFTAANFAALLLLYFLLSSILGARASSPAPLNLGSWTASSALPPAICVLMLAVNVPLQRTLFYGQINLHVANLILLSLLWSGPRPALSAAALALAAHLKIIPLVFMLPFLFRRNWRWLGWFGFFMLAIGAATLWAGGAAVFHGFLANTRAALAAPPETNFRDNSIDSFFRATAYILKHLAGFTIPSAALVWLILALKGVLLAGALFLLAARASSPAFSDTSGTTGREEENFHYRSFVVLSFLMVLLSPVLWEHYPVFLIFPFLALFRSITAPGHRVALIAAWFLIFCVPTFDFYPFSYTRLAGILICLPLIVRCRNNLRFEI